MLIDRPQIVEGSVIVNATVPSGATFPTNPNNGELFYSTVDGGLYIYLQDDDWFKISLQHDLTNHANDTNLHLTAAQNTLLDGLNASLTATELNYVDGVTAPIQNQFVTLTNDLTNHTLDQTKHLTPTQNTWIDAITVSSTEVNYLSGVTSNVQTQINTTASTAATNLANHANDASIHITSPQNIWLDQVIPGSGIPVATPIEVGYLSGVTSSVQTQINNTASTAATNLANHAADMSLHLTSTQNTWLDAITASAAEVNQLVGVTSPVQTQLNSKLALAGGTMTGSIVIPAGQHISIADAPVAAQHAANKAYVDSLISGLSWLNPILDPDLKQDNLSAPPVTSTDEVYIVGASPTGAWAGLAGRAVYWNGSVWVDILGRAVAIGDRFGVVLEHGGAAAGGLSGQQNKIAQITNATPGAITYTFTTPINGNAVFVNNQLSPHFGHGYTYIASSSSWIEFAGPSAIPAGTGLSYIGNTLNVNLGAGVAQLPTDEVGIDILAGGGLMTTVDGTNSSTLTNAQLSLTKVGTPGTYTVVTTDAHGRVTGGNTTVNIPGGVAGGIVYQSGVGFTSISTAGSAGQILQSGGAGAPTWTSAPTISGANFSTGTIPNSALVNSTITLGSSVVGLGSTTLVLAGLTSVSATTFYGTTTAFGTADTTLATTAFVDRLRDVPSNPQVSAYTLQLADRGRSIDTTSNVIVPANTVVAFPVGSTITVTNIGGGSLQISIDTDTLRLAGSILTGTRTLGNFGVATLRKIDATTWIISGSGLS